MDGPDRDTIENLARRHQFSLTPEEVDEFAGLVEQVTRSIDASIGDESSFDEAPIAAARRLRRPPSVEDDPFNAIVRSCHVRAFTSGSLSEIRIGLKDNISVAGIPLTMGSRLMDGFSPRADSLRVERLLQAGGEITAILNMDSFALSAGAETSDYGVVRNPVVEGRTAGGSSGGAAAALYYHDVDLTFGTDQGGSVRIPASWCGVLGLKPTFGVVPYTGIGSLDQSVDHVGPMAREVRMLALAMDAVSGVDESDPRQAGVPEVAGFGEAVEGAPERYDGLTVGILSEGMGEAAGVDPSTRAATLAAVERMAALGANVTEVSIPEHITIGQRFWLALVTEGQMATLRDFGNGHGWQGRYWTDFASIFGRSLQTSGELLPPTIKAALVIGSYLNERYFGTFYAQAMNSRRALRHAYDRALDRVDVLAMPTSTILPFEHLPQAEMAERVTRGWSMLGNVTQANMTGHPALSMPAGRSGDLPVGVMLVARRYEDAKLLSIARTYERAYGWYPSGPPSAER